MNYWKASWFRTVFSIFYISNKEEKINHFEKFSICVKLINEKAREWSSYARKLLFSQLFLKKRYFRNTFLAIILYLVSDIKTIFVRRNACVCYYLLQSTLLMLRHSFWSKLELKKLLNNQIRSSSDMECKYTQHFGVLCPFCL